MFQRPRSPMRSEITVTASLIYPGQPYGFQVPETEPVEIKLTSEQEMLKPDKTSCSAHCICKLKVRAKRQGAKVRAQAKEVISHKMKNGVCFLLCVLDSERAAPSYLRQCEVPREVRSAYFDYYMEHGRAKPLDDYWSPDKEERLRECLFASLTPLESAAQDEIIHCVDTVEWVKKTKNRKMTTPSAALEFPPPFQSLPLPEPIPKTTTEPQILTLPEELMSTTTETPILGSAQPASDTTTEFEILDSSGAQQVSTAATTTIHRLSPFKPPVVTLLSLITTKPPLTRFSNSSDIEETAAEVPGVSAGASVQLENRMLSPTSVTTCKTVTVIPEGTTIRQLRQRTLQHRIPHPSTPPTNFSVSEPEQRTEAMPETTTIQLQDQSVLQRTPKRFAGGCSAVKAAEVPTVPKEACVQLEKNPTLQQKNPNPTLLPTSVTTCETAAVIPEGITIRQLRLRPLQHAQSSTPPTNFSACETVQRRESIPKIRKKVQILNNRTRQPPNPLPVPIPTGSDATLVAETQPEGKTIRQLRLRTLQHGIPQYNTPPTNDSASETVESTETMPETRTKAQLRNQTRQLPNSLPISIPTLADSDTAPSLVVETLSKRTTIQLRKRKLQTPDPLPIPLPTTSEIETAEIAEVIPEKTSIQLRNRTLPHQNVLLTLLPKTCETAKTVEKRPERTTAQTRTGKVNRDRVPSETRSIAETTVSEEIPIIANIDRARLLETNSPGPYTTTETGVYWLVEKIVGATMVKKRLWYLIKWQGYPIEDNTWEPAGDLNCVTAVKKFFRLHKRPTRNNDKVLSPEGIEYENIRAELGQDEETPKASERTNKTRVWHLRGSKRTGRQKRPLKRHRK